MTPDPDEMSDEALIEHIRAGGDPPPGDDVGRLLEMLRDAADGKPA